MNSNDPVTFFIDVPQAEEELARLISDQVLAFVMLHEEENHDKQPCWDERMNFIAFICHRIGIKSDQASWIIDRLKEYELQHNENCPAREPGHDIH